MPAKSLMCLIVNCLLSLSAQASLLNESHVVAADNATAALVPDVTTFAVPTAGNHTITLTDQGRASNGSAGNPFTALSVVITQGDKLIKLLSVNETLGSNGVATATVALTSGSYQVQVLGNTTTAGLYSLVINSATSTLLSDGGAINAASPSSVFTTQVALSLNAGQSYAVSLQDLVFPAALDSASITIDTSGNSTLACPLSKSSPGPCTFTAGANNTLLIVADATTNAVGLMSVTIASGATNVFAKSYAVGALPQPTSIDLTSSNDYTLTFSDVGTPAPLTSLRAVLVEGAQVLATNDTTTAFAAAQGTAQLYVMAVPDATTHAGIYFAQINRGTTKVFSNAVPVTAPSSGSIDGFSYKFTAASTGSYQLNLTDLAAPQQLGQLYAALTHGTEKVASIYGGTPTASVTADLTAGDEYVVSIVSVTGSGNPFGTYGVSLYGPPVIISFTANQTNDIRSGDSVTVSWNTDETTSCTASGGWSGSKATGGSESFGPVNATTDLTLTCAGATGNATQTLHLAVASGSSGNSDQHRGGGGTLSWGLLLSLMGVLGARKSVMARV